MQIQKILTVSILNSDTVEKQSTINKVYAVILLLLIIATSHFAWRSIHDRSEWQAKKEAAEKQYQIDREQWLRDRGDTVRATGHIQQQSFFQLEWLKEIPDVPAPIFALFFVTASGIVAALWKRSKEDKKEMKELLQAFLPLLQEIKTTLSFLVKE